MSRLERFPRWLALAVLAASAWRCASLPPESGVAGAVSPSPEVPWTPPPEAKKILDKDRAPAQPPPVLPSDILKTGGSLTLAQAIDLALRNSPVTRDAWFRARAAAADVGSKQGAWFPSLDLDANITRQKQGALGGTVTILNTTYGPSLTLDWLLLDLGGRQADIDEAKAALFSADWSHDASIQNAVLDVASAYYQYLYAKALVSAQEASLKSAKESLAAAEERHRAGVATIADVLLSRTAKSQAEFDLATAEGLVQTIRGALATQLGVPANIPVEAGDLPEIENLDKVTASVDSLIDQAAAERPDLAARRMDAEKAAAHVRSVRSAGLPTLNAFGSIGRNYYEHSTGTNSVNVYSGAILFRFPVFSGFSSVYAVRQAEEEAQAARAELEDFSNRVILQVWRSYYGMRTASQRVRATRDLLESARQSEEVASGRYKAGVGGILDLLAAQSAHANARAQDVQSRTEWYLATAQLAHDVGALGPKGVERKP
jgi:outer membrane protein